MTSRSQYLLFLFIWLTFLFVIFFVALALGLPIEARALRGDLFIAGVIALAPAAGGYLIVMKTGSVLDAWRVRRGHDVYQERNYEDDGGFIHLNEVPSCDQEQEVSLKEIVSGLEQVASSDDLSKDLK